MTEMNHGYVLEADSMRIHLKEVMSQGNIWMQRLGWATERLRPHTWPHDEEAEGLAHIP